MTAQVRHEPAPDVVHFYSWSTGVSLELPAGFERLDEDADSATYADLGDHVAPEPGDAVVRVRVAATLGDDVPLADRARAVSRLVDGFASAGAETISRTVREVDDEPVETVVTRTADGQVLHQTAASTPTRLVAVIGVVERDEQLAGYDRSVESMRFAEL